MTNEVAIRELKKFVALKTTMEPAFLKVAVDALENADKYRWHDLRGKSKDLPKHGVDCIAVRDYMGLPRQIPANYDLYWYDCINNEIANDVIAWRYIEPWEVDG